MISLAFLTAVVVPTGHQFNCTPTRVWDGGGPIWCAEGPRVRLAGIAAREIDGDLSCSMVRKGWALRWDRFWKGHRCPEVAQ